MKKDIIQLQDKNLKIKKESNSKDSFIEEAYTLRDYINIINCKISKRFKRLEH